MKAFMDQDFLLQTRTASELYHKYAERTPVLDYHCHINPAEIADNRRFDNITTGPVALYALVRCGGGFYHRRCAR